MFRRTIHTFEFLIGSTTHIYTLGNFWRYITFAAKPYPLRDWHYYSLSFYDSGPKMMRFIITINVTIVVTAVHFRFRNLSHNNHHSYILRSSNHRSKPNKREILSIIQWPKTYNVSATVFAFELLTFIDGNAVPTTVAFPLLWVQ